MSNLDRVRVLNSAFDEVDNCSLHFPPLFHNPAAAIASSRPPLPKSLFTERGIYLRILSLNDQVETASDLHKGGYISSRSATQWNLSNPQSCWRYSVNGLFPDRCPSCHQAWLSSEQGNFDEAERPLLLAVSGEQTDFTFLIYTSIAHYNLHKLDKNIV